MLDVYRRYPFKVPLRTKFVNLFRFFFTFAILEKALVSIVRRSRNSIWKKFVPPVYLYLPGTYREVERNGIRYRLDISILLDHSIYFHLISDKAWFNLFDLIKPDFRIIDAGANIGFLSLNFARMCPDGFVYSFEPDSETFSKLSTNIKRNSFSNIKIFKQGLGENAEQKTLYKIYVNNPGANRILPSASISHYGTETVEVTTLDVFFRNENLTKVDLVKIDVEGFELFVLKGGRDFLERFKPILFIELVDENLRLQNCSALGLLDYIVTIGYSILDANTMGPVDRSLPRHTDILCFPLVS